MSHGESFVGPRSSPRTPEIVGRSSLRNTTFHQTSERALNLAGTRHALLRLFVDQNRNHDLRNPRRLPGPAGLKLDQLSRRASSQRSRTDPATFPSDQNLQLILRMSRHGGSSPNSQPNNPNKPSKTSNSAMKSSAYSAKWPTSLPKTISPSGRV